MQNGYERPPYVASHNEEIVEHLYHAGFQMGNYADTILIVHGRQYRLHAILLSRSPYLAHLMSTTPSNAPIRTITVPTEEEPEVTEEGFAVALGYLYSSVSLQLVNPHNARAVLASACYLGGLPDLCSYAYDVCRNSISVETVDDWLRFVERIPPPPEEGGPIDVPTSVFGPYAGQLRADVLHFLVTTLPHNLQSFETVEGAPHTLNGRTQGFDNLLHIYARVPFDMFKQAVESPELPIGEIVLSSHP
ncbi:hypothetical protein M422DRAFT_228554 [Sphaerobolus stellatus SS14]|uniref:BTB domain-containing protein n=1 Tax=Sphaerobolus stellatus (strain SS14) TaxID=990650 RepID=A0A0C9VPE8_SPHS4|nr:hypothetical protein M422DRAFT_228554 [Sphaerobolus stellatus SS14]